MLKPNLRPKTLTGIKTLAHDLKVLGVVPTHNAGLEMSSGLAGFANYKAALNHLQSNDESPTAARRFPLFISIWWRDPSSRASGRETVRIETSRPLDELLPFKRTIRHGRYLSGLKRGGPDHLFYRELNAGQSQGRIQAAGAARTIAFIEATGLLPSGVWKKEYPLGDRDNALPRRDHSGLWHDPETGQYVVTDEPYMSRSDSPEFNAEREAWARQWGMDLRAVDWGGMYYPDGGSSLYVFTDANGGYDLGRLVERLNALPAPMGSEIWTGESARSIFEFVTPGTAVEQALKAAEKAQRPKPLPRTGPRNSATYYGTFGDRRSRPAAKLPLSVHERMGELLKAAIANLRPPTRAHGQLNRIRSDIEDWFGAEYPSSDLERERFLNTYYKALKDRSLLAEAGYEYLTALAQLDEIKGLLTGSYPDSAPLRNMLARLDKVRGHLAA